VGNIDARHSTKNQSQTHKKDELSKFSKNSPHSYRISTKTGENPMKEIWRQTQTIEKVQRRFLISRLYNITQSECLHIQWSKISKRPAKRKPQQELPKHSSHEANSQFRNTESEF
jgi:hypothetical protein